MTLRFRFFAVATLALAVLGGSASAVLADCVTTLSFCAQACDQRLKEGDPQRPQCAQSCVSDYGTCRRFETLQTTINRGALPNATLAPQAPPP
jgi:hypothetical protein